MARRRFAPIVLFVLLLVAGCSDDDPAEPASSSGSGSGSASGSASGSTASEPPSSTSSSGPSSTSTSGKTSSTTPADGIAFTGPTGSGSLTYSLSVERSEFCYRIQVQGIGRASAAQLLRTDGGEVVLGLQPPAEGTIDSCAATDALLLQELQGRPGNFAVEVRGPQGNLRATLR